MKSYENIRKDKVDEIILESKGENIEYIRDGERSCDDLDIICDFIEKGYDCDIKREKGKYLSKRIVITFTKNSM